MHRIFRAILQWLIVTILLFFLVQILIHLYDVQWIYKDFFLNNMWYTTIAIMSVFFLFAFFPYNTVIKKSILTIIVLLNTVVGISFFSWVEWNVLIYRSIILVILSIVQMLIWQRKNPLRYVILFVNLACILVVLAILLLPNYDKKPTLSEFYTLQPNILQMFIADAPIILQESRPILTYKIWNNEKSIPITSDMSFLPIEFTQDSIITFSATQELQNTYAIIQMYDGEVYPVPSQAGIAIITLSSSGYQIEYINRTWNITPSLATQTFIQDLVQQREQAFQKYITDTIKWSRVLHPIIDRSIRTMLQIAYTVFPAYYFENIQNYYSTQILLEKLGMKKNITVMGQIDIELPDTTQFQESIQKTFLYKRLFMTE